MVYELGWLNKDGFNWESKAEKGSTIQRDVKDSRVYNIGVASFKWIGRKVDEYSYEIGRLPSYQYEAQDS